MNTFTEQDLRAALTSLAEPEPGPVDVWTPLHSRIVRRRYARLGAVAAIAVAVVAFALVGWPRSPDSLRVAGDGKVRVTLSADRQLSKAELNTAVDVLRQRMSALGITAEIRTTGNAVTVSVAGADADLVSRLGARGEVQWRQVLEVQAVTETGTGTGLTTAGDLAGAESAFQRQRCPTSGGVSAAHSTVIPAAGYLVTCSTDGSTKYLLAPSSLGNADVASAEFQQNTANVGGGAGTADVTIAFTHAGSEAWRQLTARAAQQPAPQQCQPPGGCNSIAVVVDGKVLATPSVNTGPGGILGGMTQITGLTPHNEARALAAEIGAPPLPAPLADSRG